MVSPARASRGIATATALVLLVEAGALLKLGVSFPAVPAPVELGQPLGPQIERVERALVDLPPLTGTFSGSALWRYRHELRAAELDTEAATRARHVDGLNQAMARIRASYVGTVTLLATTLLVGGFALVSTAWGRPSIVALLAPLAGCLVIAPILTEPLLGADYGAALLPFVLPMLIGGAAVLWLERASFRAPARRVGAALQERPVALILLSLTLLGGLGAAAVGLGSAERLGLLVRVGVVLLANVVVYLVLAAVLGVRALVGRLRRRGR